MDSHFDVFHPGVGEADLGDALGQRFQQLDRFTGDDTGDLLCKGPIIDGLGEVIGGSRRPGVDAERDVDAEALVVLPLVRKPAMSSAR